VAGVLAHACYGACVHFPKHHACGFEEANRGVDSEEITGRAGAKSVCIVHTEPICYPVETMARELGQFVRAIGGGWKRLLQLVIRLPVIATHSEAAVFYIHILGGVLGGLADDVGARG